MTNQVQVLKRLVKRRMEQSLMGRSFRVDELIDHMRREVSVVRTEDPSLNEYHLHDMTLLFGDQEIILQIDFRK
jgi:hypothetical protein